MICSRVPCQQPTSYDPAPASLRRSGNASEKSTRAPISCATARGSSAAHIATSLRLSTPS